MASYDYDNRYTHSRRPESYYPSSRPYDGYSRHASISNPHSRLSRPLTEMSSSPKLSGGYSSPSSASKDYHDRYAAPPPLPKRPSAQPSNTSPTSSYRSSPRYSRRPRWPPSPTCEDESAALAKEHRSGSEPLAEAESADNGEAKARGSVDQYPILEEIEQPAVNITNDERRFVLVSDPSDSEDAKRRPSRRRRSASRSARRAREERRKSFAERGNMAPIKTDLSDPSDPPVYTERTSTPYSYNPQKDSSRPKKRDTFNPSAGEYFLSPESTLPTTTSVPRSVPSNDTWESAQRDQNARPPRKTDTHTLPIHSRYDSLTGSPRQPKNDVFEDSDADEDTTHLRTERKPARYSFVKSDLQKEDLRTNLMDSQPSSDRRRQDPPRSAYDSNNNSSGSSKNPTPGSQSPRSSNSSLNGYPSRPRPAPVETGHLKHPRTYSDSRPSRPASPLRPSSPLARETPSSPPRSPRLPPRRPAEPSYARPPSRSGAPRPSSPLSSSSNIPPAVPITEADWHATYPPASATERSRPSPRFSRHESMPVPMPRIDVHSPSPARPPQPDSPLPYPVDDIRMDAYMPPEEAYQYDHSNTPTSPYPGLNRPFPEPPQLSPSPIPPSPRERHSPTFNRPLASSRHTTAPEEVPRMQRARSNSMRSQSSFDGRRSERTASSLDRPLPTCPRSVASAKYSDWYTLEGCPNADICPDCYNGVFADTKFATYFKPVRRYDARFCDFSSPWMRLAWLLTIKQRREEPTLLYALTSITDLNPPCPNERESHQTEWYGISDQRDGVHVANFRVCPCDLKMTEALFPSVRGYMTRLSPTNQISSARPALCSLRTSSKRFPKYLDLLVEIDEEARTKGRSPDIQRFINLARETAFRDECPRDTPTPRKPWHFIPSLPELTVCEDCYSEVIWPAIQSRKNAIANLFNRNIQLVPGEDAIGSTCCLYSPRMRRIFARASDDADFTYLQRKAIARHRQEVKLGSEIRQIKRWLETMNATGGYSEREFERLRRQLREAEEDWASYE